MSHTDFVGRWLSVCLGARLGAAVVLVAALAACGGGGGSDEPVQHTVTVSVTGNGTVASANGSINCGTQCSTTLDSGASLTLSASPATGSALQSWGGACAGTSGSTCTVTINQATNVSATFAQTPPQNFALNVTVTGNGTVTSNPQGINCPTTCSANYVANAAVTLTATPAAGQLFNGWSGACTGNTPTCTVTMSAARSATAAFVAAPTSQTLSLTISGSGSVTSSPAGINCTASCSANFASATAVTLTAAAASGSTFSGWSGACTGSAPVCTVTMSSAIGVTATFVASPAGWTDTIPAGVTSAQHVQVVIDGASNSTLAWTQAVQAGINSVFASRSIAGGAWSAPQEIDSSTSDSSEAPQLAVDAASGRVMAIWIASSGLWGRAFAPETGWGAAQLIQSHNTNVVGFTINNYRVAIDGVGEAIAVWDRRPDGRNDVSVWASRFVLASGWTTPEMIEANAGTSDVDARPTVAMLANGRAVVVWPSLGAQRRGFWTNTFTSGSGWGTATELVRVASPRVPHFQELRADSQGSAVLTWLEFESVSGQIREGAMSKRLVAGSWQSANTEVAPFENAARAIVRAPVLAVSALGQATVGWTLPDNSLRASVATAAGAWGATALVKPGSASVSVAGEAIAIDDQGNAFAAWQQWVPNQSDPELWISHYVTGAGWAAATRHQTTSGLVNAPALAMNGRGDAVVVWFQVTGSPSGLLSRFYRSGR